MCVRIGWKQRALVLSLKLSNTNSVSTWMGEILTQQCSVECSCIITIIIYFILFFDLFIHFFYLNYLFIYLFFVPAVFISFFTITYINDYGCILISKIR